ncbi:MAG: signal peptide peptidase SppA [Deltaproteobacteria bacterium]|nr:signal peptide peptidase SppA [Deltaproteobacteria bacterium]
MKTALGLFLCLSIFLSGCVVITLPTAEPLVEKVIGGEGDSKVLLIDISGIITDSDRKDAVFSTKQNMTARIREELDKATEDEDVKAVVLRIDSPGGAVTTSDIIAHEIKKFKDKKKVPVIAELMDVAASGGYYIAAASDRIIAHPTTVTGSIGVVAFSVNASGLLEKVGIANQTIKSGDKKDIGSILRPMTGDERIILQSIIDDLYERFLDVVMDGRKGSFTREELKKIADGRVYTARQALDLKLIDEIGYLDDAVEAAKSKAGIKEARLVAYALPRSYRNNIYSSLADLPVSINLVNIDAGSFTGRPGMSFMYLWMQ